MTETTSNKQLMTVWLTPTWTCGEGTNGVHRRFSGFICTKAFCFVWQQDKWSSSNLCFSSITHLNTNDSPHIDQSLQHKQLKVFINQQCTTEHWRHLHSSSSTSSEA